MSDSQAISSSLVPTLDVLLQTLAEDTWENLREAKRLSVRYGEETITDILMLGLRRKGFKLFKQTSLRDEAKYGTDFECWLGNCNMGWVGYAVQAKKLDFRTGNYRYLGHVVKGQKKRQVKILKAYAKARKLTPRYCLYSHSFNVDRADLRCCSRQFPEGELGCTMTPAGAIEWAIATPGGKDFRSLQRDPRTVPWRCLAICPRLQKSLSTGVINPDDLSPLLDTDSITHPRLPHDIGVLLEESQRQMYPRLANGSSGPFENSEIEVDFEEFGIGVDSRDMDDDHESSPSFIIPKRVYILELLERPNS